MISASDAHTQFRGPAKLAVLKALNPGAKMPEQKPSDWRDNPTAVWVLYQELGTLSAVGEQLGVTAETIRQFLKKAGCRTNKSRWTAEEFDRVRAYGALPKDCRPAISDFAASMGRSVDAVDLKLSRMGISRQGRKRRDNESKPQNDLPWGKWTKHEHPRGFLGGKHTEETKAVLSARSLKMWEGHKANGVGLMSDENRQRRSDQTLARNLADISAGTNAYSRCKRGYREDLGKIHFRSAWEANIARYLNLLISLGDLIKWEYEKETFWFEKIRRGVRSYTPDFKVWPKSGEPYFIEVKGWMDPKSKTKLKRMRKYYPAVRIDVIGEARYRGIAKTAATMIPLWETKSKGVRISIAAPVEVTPEPRAKGKKL